MPRRSLWLLRLCLDNRAANSIAFAQGAKPVLGFRLSLGCVDLWPAVPHSGGRRSIQPGVCDLVAVSDNGTELTSMAILRWSQECCVTWHYIAPGKPRRTGSATASTADYAMNASTKRCSPPCTMQGWSSAPGGSTTILSGSFQTRWHDANRVRRTTWGGENPKPCCHHFKHQP
jgi:hypothetical protein